MFRNCAVILVIASICSFFYGAGNLYLEVEPNACRMTYMFGAPMFARLHFDSNKHYPNYGLYYYYEGKRHAVPLKARMSGAPVIFVPGNAGSYKQVRSMASVALRKSLHSDTAIHLDYYTIDFDEEHSGLYGGYLYHQKAFLKHCIRTVLALYRDSSEPTIVLIGHSMGGKIAQSILTDGEISPHINTILSISSPLDQPVLNLDERIASFYEETNTKLRQIRTYVQPSAATNVCNSLLTALSPLISGGEHSAQLDNVLLISTGGGNRDLLVRPGLTSSQFNDIHSMTSAIPRVSLSCDHLSAVWCLQFMQTINRFLFSIAHVRDDDRSIVFGSDKQRNLQLATTHFVKSRHHARTSVIQFKPHFNWHEERRLVINKFFSNGLKAHYYELISILRQERFKKMAIEVLHVDDGQWLFGCAATTDPETGKLFCEKATQLPHLVQLLPNGDRDARSVAILDLHNLRQTYRDWTHILVRLPPSNGRIGFNLDIYDPADRTVDIRMPRWYTYASKLAINETLQGTIHYRLRISDLIEPSQGLSVHIEPLQCIQPDYRVTVRLCVPWAAGFERYQTITSPDQTPGLYINVPVVVPKQYNTTLNPLIVDLYLDANCRYRVSYRYAYDDALSRLLLEFYSWLPAHLACVLFIVLKNQVDKFQTRGSLKSLRPYVGYFQFSSLYIVTGCRLLKKAVLSTRILPIPEPLDYGIHVSIIIHCAAIALSLLLAFGMWMALVFYGNGIYRIALRLTRLSQVTSNILLSIMTHLPITFGILTIGVAIGACSGIAILLAFIFYFLMLSNAYKDYLEDYLWQKAADLLKSSLSSSTPEQATDDEQPEIESDADGDGDGEADADMENTTTDSNSEPSNNTEKAVKTTTATEQQQQPVGDDAEPCVGLHNFPFHITLLLMLLMLLPLNAPTTLAWIRSRRHGIDLPDPILYPNIIILGALSMLLQMKAPQQCSGYWTMSVALYLCSGIVLLYCQAAIYRLNFLIAAAFALLAIHQFVQLVWRKLAPRLS